MKIAKLGLFLLPMILGLAACDSDDLIYYDDEYAAPPENLAAWYYNKAVYVTWELSPAWNNDAFRVFAKRKSDANYYLIAEVTNCSGGLCSYADVNIRSDITYEYYVASVSPSGLETPSDWAVEVYVPIPDPPPVPGTVEVVALDNANFIRWSNNARNATDFSFYRVYQAQIGGDDFILGETDSEGFLDLLALNGESYSYFVTSVDSQGHESFGSQLATGTPRPDYHGEWIYAYEDVPTHAGFRFSQDELTYPILDGNSPNRHFRVEVDADGWWLVPGPGTQVYDGLFETTALKCGVVSDSDCVALDQAPLSGYVNLDMPLYPQTTYVLRVVGNDGLTHYGVIRVTLLGFDQDAAAIMIFDWAYQLQAGNPNLAPREAGGR
ncbi:MAG: hypothetical protein ABIF09_19565 [Gemmatimonadota bacterium]